jgi:hypothetical protein
MTPFLMFAPVYSILSGRAASRSKSSETIRRASCVDWHIVSRQWCSSCTSQLSLVDVDSAMQRFSVCR